MNRRHPLPRLGVKFVAAATLAFLVSFGIYLLLYEVVLNEVLSSGVFAERWKEKEDAAIASFQEYVTVRGFTVQEAVRDVEWEKRDPTTYLYVEEYNEADLDWYDPLDYGGTMVYCADGPVYVYAFVDDSHYEQAGQLIAMLTAMICFCAIFLPYIIHVLRRITRLSREMEILAGGDLSYQIVSPGRDELAELGRNIEGMRLAALEQMARETALATANSRLITSLSHDLRTPLTKLTGYLEILQYKKYKNEAEREFYLQKAAEKAGQMRYLSDEMARHFQVGPAGENRREEVSGPILLGQLLAEQCFDLQAAGFSVQPPVMEGDYRLAVQVEDVRRVFDNLFSNIKKYAAPQSPVLISTGDQGLTVWIAIENEILITGTRDSRGIGVPTMRFLMARNGGRLESVRDKTRYRSTLWFQKL